MTTFPTSADTFPSAGSLSGGTLATNPHSTLHGNLGDALTAVEQYLINRQAGSLSRLALSTTAPPTGNASGSTHTISFPATPVDSTYEKVGTDLEIDSLDDTKINILTAGVYSLFVLAIVQNNLLTFADLNVGNFDPFTGFGLGFSKTDNLAGHWASIFANTYYVPSPTSLQFIIDAETDDSSTWDVNSVDVRIQRIA